MRNKGLVAIMMIALLLISSVAMAGGNFYIPGSRDNEGGLGEDGKSFDKLHINNRVVFEGATSDGFEATLVAPDPGSDITYTLPAASGTLATTAGGDVTLTDTYLFVGSSSNLAVGVTMSGDVEITNAGVTNLVADSVNASTLITNIVTMTIAGPHTGQEIEVESGSILMGTQIISGFSNDITLDKNFYPADGDIWLVNVSQSDTGDTLIINGVFARPAQ